VEFELVLAVVLVVLVIFLFLRNLPATIIPSLSVPLSLVGTLAVMYLFGFSLDNLSLMALTISTGFVVDDAIVMIENISRYVEGRHAAGGGAEGLRADRLHHHLADRLADRGADPAAVHGRRGRPAVPRVRHHARGDHRHLGGGLADAGADDVRAAGAPPPDANTRNRFDLAPSAVQLDHRRYDRGLTGCWTTRADAVVVVLTLLLTVLPVRRDPQRLLPGAGHRRDPGHLLRRAVISFAADGACSSRRWPTRS
jgi:hypothetical protein